MLQRHAVPFQNLVAHRRNEITGALVSAPGVEEDSLAPSLVQRLFPCLRQDDGHAQHRRGGGQDGVHQSLRSY